MTLLIEQQFAPEDDLIFRISIRPSKFMFFLYRKNSSYKFIDMSLNKSLIGWYSKSLYLVLIFKTVLINILT